MFKEGYLSKSRLALFSCLSFIGGVGLASFLPESVRDYGLWVFGAGLIFTLALAAFWGNKKNDSAIKNRALIFRLVFLLAAFMSFGVWRYSLAIPRPGQDRIWSYNGQRVKFIGRVKDEPDLRENNIKYKIETEQIEVRSGNGGTVAEISDADNTDGEKTAGIKHMPVKGTVLATAALFPQYNYGDRLELTCGLEKPEPINDFFYDRYLARYDIYSVCYYPKIKLISYPEFKILSPAWLYSQVLNLRKGIKVTANRGMGEPESSLAQAITFGIRQNIPQELKDQFSQTGLTHIMAVSGMNISILVMVIMNVLLAAGLNRKLAFYFTTVWIIIFVILVAVPASAVRAGVMGFLVLWALQLGRLNKITNTIAMAGAAMTLANPKILRDDLGFQLSFMATLSLVYFYPIFSAWAKNMKPINRAPKIISETLLITLAAQVLTLPILIYNFRFISLIAPLANLLALWAIIPVMFFTFFGIIFSCFFPSLAQMLLLPAWAFSKYLIVVTKSLAIIPFSHPQTGYLRWQYLLIYYLILAIYLKRANKGQISIDFS